MASRPWMSSWRANRCLKETLRSRPKRLQAIAGSLWQERVAKTVWDRFRAITDASKEKEQRS